MSAPPLLVILVVSPELGSNKNISASPSISETKAMLLNVSELKHATVNSIRPISMANRTPYLQKLTIIIAHPNPLPMYLILINLE